jgi:hypothetical protein
MKHLTFLVFALFYVGEAIAHPPTWQTAEGRPCEDVCTTAVWSGTYSSPDARLNGQKFYVCRVDAGDGVRVGYNLKPNWSRHCWVGHGGQEKSLRRYECLCG